jgi:hypothetical protein
MFPTPIACLTIFCLVAFIIVFCLIIRLVIGPTVVIHITNKLLILKIILCLTAFFFEIFLLYCFFSFLRLLLMLKSFLLPL